MLTNHKKVSFPSGAKLPLNTICDLSTFCATNLLWMQECLFWPKTFCSTGTQRTPTEKRNRTGTIPSLLWRKELAGSHISVLEKQCVRNNNTATETYINRVYQAAENESCSSNAAVSALVMCGFNGLELFYSTTLPRSTHNRMYNHMLCKRVRWGC